MHTEHERQYGERLSRVATLESELRLHESVLSEREAQLTRELAAVKARWGALHAQLAAVRGEGARVVDLPRVPPPVGRNERDAALSAREMAVEQRRRGARSREQAVRYLREALQRAKQRLERCSVEVKSMSDLPVQETPAYPGTESVPRGMPAAGPRIRVGPSEPVEAEPSMEMLGTDALETVETFAQADEPEPEPEAPVPNPVEPSISWAELEAANEIVPAEDLSPTPAPRVSVKRTPAEAPIARVSVKRVPIPAPKPVEAQPPTPRVSVKRSPPPAEPAAEIPEETTEERRAKHRARLDVEVTLGSESNFYSGFSRDLSEGGLFVATFDLEPIGSKVQVQFTLPSGANVAATGVVRWTREVSSDGGVDGQWPGMGLEFVDLDPGAQQAILSFMAMREPIFFLD